MANVVKIAAAGPQPRPTVSLRRVNCDAAQPGPPAGQEGVWRKTLRVALATESDAFVDASLFQLIAAARLPGGGLSETAVNATLAMVSSASPQNEMEAALAVQMAATHCAAMSILSGIAGGHTGERNLAIKAAAASKLSRTFAIQVEVFRRLRSGGSQHIRVEHIHLHEGAQAVIGNVQAGSRGQ
jgi:hypothetical protein